jgi:hypothetical protein
VASVHIERGIRVPNSVASRLFGQQGSVQQLPTPPAVALVAIHPRRTHGWDAESTSFGSFSFQSRSPQRPLLVSVRIHHVRAPVVKALSTP